MAKTPTAEPENTEVNEFLTDPKHAKQRDFMRALFRKMQAEDVEAAQQATKDKGGNFIDNFFTGMTGGFLGGDK